MPDHRSPARKVMSSRRRRGIDRRAARRYRASLLDVRREGCCPGDLNEPGYGFCKSKGRSRRLLPFMYATHATDDTRLTPVRIGRHRIGCAAVFRNLMRRTLNAIGPAAGLWVAAARSAGHARSPTVIRSCSLPGCRTGPVAVARRHLTLRRGDSARHQQRRCCQHG